MEQVICREAAFVAVTHEAEGTSRLLFGAIAIFNPRGDFSHWSRLSSLGLCRMGILAGGMARLKGERLEQTVHELVRGEGV